MVSKIKVRVVQIRVLNLRSGESLDTRPEELVLIVMVGSWYIIVKAGR